MMMTSSAVLLVFPLLSLASVDTKTEIRSSPEACAICGAASATVFASRDPHRVVEIPGLIPRTTCGGSFIKPNNGSISDCQSVQNSFADLCGCTKNVHGGHSLCEFCPFNMGFPKRELPFSLVSVSSWLFSSNEWLFGLLNNEKNNNPITCEFMKTYLESLIQQDDQLCSTSIWAFSDYCGCNLINTEWHPPCQFCDQEQQQQATTEATKKPPTTGNNYTMTLPDNSSNNASDLTNIVVMDRELNVTGLPFRTCGDLQQSVGLLFIHESQQCSFFRFVFGVYCGCPNRHRKQEEQPCSLCPYGSPDPSLDGLEVTFLPELLQVVLAQQQQEESKTTSPSTTRPTTRSRNHDEKALLYSSLFSAFNPTCKIAEIIAPSFASESNECALFHLSSGYCGCPSIHEEHCVFCADEENEEKEVPPPEYKNVRLFGFLDRVPFLSSSSTHHHDYSSSFAPTCEAVFAFQYQIAHDSDLCLAGQVRNDLCGCNNGQLEYGGGTTNTKRALLAWLPRVTASLSIMGTLAIVVDVARTPARRRRVYNQLMLFMSVFDLMQSVAMIFTTLPIPTHDVLGNEWKIYGARGNDDTCTAQAFFTHTGAITSIFFNTSLATYYMLALVMGWKDQGIQNRRSRWIWIQILPMILGLTMGLAALPYYGVVFYGCHISLPPVASSRLPGIMFLVAPILTSLVLNTLMLFVVYRSVRRQAISTINRSNNTNQDESRHCAGPSDNNPVASSTIGNNVCSSPSTSNHCNRTDGGRTQEWIRRIEREVFWQIVFYLSAFYLTWPILVYASLTSGSEYHPGGFFFWIVVFMLIPFQGFLNSVVYFRPRLWRQMEKKRRHQHQRRLDARKSQERGQEEEQEHDHRGNHKKKEWIDTKASCHCSLEQGNISNPLWRDDENGKTQQILLLDEVELDGRLEPSAMIAGDIGEEIKALEESLCLQPTMEMFPVSTMTNLLRHTKTAGSKRSVVDSGGKERPPTTYEHDDKEEECKREVEDTTSQ